MPQPATTVELQLAQVVGLLTEIRDLLQAPAAPATAESAPPVAPPEPRRTSSAGRKRTASTSKP